MFVNLHESCINLLETAGKGPKLLEWFVSIRKTQRVTALF